LFPVSAATLKPASAGFFVGRFLLTIVGRKENWPIRPGHKKTRHAGFGLGRA
jgi:hypothetical protein